MRQQWKDKEYKDLLWQSATTPTPRHFDEAMESLRKYDASAHEWLKRIPPKHWSRAHFSGKIHYFMLNIVSGTYSHLICTFKQEELGVMH